MRKEIVLGLLLLCLSATSGCMVLDEIDAANAKMPKNTQAEEQIAAPAAAPQPNALLEQSKQWWKQASSLAPSDVETGIVRCETNRGTQYMSSDDCLARGGRPRGV